MPMIQTVLGCTPHLWLLVNDWNENGLPFITHVQGRYRVQRKRAYSRIMNQEEKATLGRRESNPGQQEGTVRSARGEELQSPNPVLGENGKHSESLTRSATVVSDARSAAGTGPRPLPKEIRASLAFCHSEGQPERQKTTALAEILDSDAGSRTPACELWHGPSVEDEHSFNITAGFGSSSDALMGHSRPQQKLEQYYSSLQS
ncbi:hypothetical protein C8R47DRAFT_1062837 [Mycena vitilis]|nr:hypothetical protein C8R47DRAFT_1062837 [Mycena vitilis]